MIPLKISFRGWIAFVAWKKNIAYYSMLGLVMPTASNAFARSLARLWNHATLHTFNKHLRKIAKSISS